MTWLAWRQFRANALLATVMTVAVIILLAVTRDQVAAGLADPDLSSRYRSLRLLVGTGLVGAPAFVGAFWGAPLLARELETGTHRLVWTQSITRDRWLATKLAVAGLATVVVTAACSLTFTWWSTPLDRFGSRVDPADFSQRGLVPVAYALFALLLGTLLGSVIRRTLPAMAATFVGFFVVRYSFQLFARPKLAHPVTASLPIDIFGTRPGARDRAWILSSHIVDGHGHVFRSESIQLDQTLRSSCELTNNSIGDDYTRCADQLGLHDIVRMHPADHFWLLQAWETASFLALTIALAGITFWWVRRRAA